MHYSNTSTLELGATGKPNLISIPSAWFSMCDVTAVYVSRVQCQRHAIVRCHPDVTNIKMAVENRRSVGNGARSSPYSEIATECKCTVKI